MTHYYSQGQQALPLSSFDRPQFQTEESPFGEEQHGYDQAMVFQPSFPKQAMRGGLYANFRSRVSVSTIILYTILPFFIYVYTFTLMSFWAHYNYPMVCYIGMAMGFLIVIVLGIRAARVAQRAKSGHSFGESPQWPLFLFLSCFLAWVLAFLLGDWNFVEYMRPFYDVVTTASYDDIDPVTTHGGQIMDGNRVLFAQGSRLDTYKAVSFTNDEVYCVAPITLGDAKHETYDFWAVGTNCCKGVAGDFGACGSANPKARSGLKLMRGDLMPFFRLAVQQAEATFHIKANHPTFFYWMLDPNIELGAYQTDAFKFFFMSSVMYFVLQLGAVVAVAGYLGKN